ncbi:MAG: GNAT family N-acetyltransferase [Proteobacteria bacterium]|nr:GNAT family N-acetyltransferase [Pseudomonadota bacterium]
MSARARFAVGLRPFLPEDAPLLAEIFRASIDGLTAEDYSPAQRDAWAATADDAPAFAARLARQLTLIAVAQGAAVGFVCLKGDDHIDMIYVHPAMARRGVAGALCDAIEKLACARGAKRLRVDASDTAQAFFAQRGFVSTQRNTLAVGGEWLVNTSMEKPITPEKALS